MTPEARAEKLSKAIVEIQQVPDTYGAVKDLIAAEIREAANELVAEKMTPAKRAHKIVSNMTNAELSSPWAHQDKAIELIAAEIIEAVEEHDKLAIDRSGIVQKARAEAYEDAAKIAELYEDN